MKFFNRKGFMTLLQVAIISFVVIVGILMLLYPDRNGHSGGYPFSREFVSALGMTKTPQGIPNVTNALVFNIFLGICMVALIPFWVLRSRCISKSPVFQNVALFCCTIFSLGILGVALTPYNLHSTMHNISVYSALVIGAPGMLIMMLCTGNGYYLDKLKNIVPFTIIAILACEIVLAALQQAHVLKHRPLYPLLQKFNIALFLVWLFYELNLYRKRLSGIL